MMPRRSGLTRKGSQVRQRRHLPLSSPPACSLASARPSPGFRPASAGSVRISNVLPGRRARTLSHEQQGLSCRRTGVSPAYLRGGVVVADAASTARTMWTLFEPVHAVTYFTADSRSAYEQAGLRGFWRGYFAGRAAPLGAVNAAVVAASFFNFAPAFVGRAIPGVWELITPEDALRARLEGATAALRGLLAGQESEAAAAGDLLWRAIGELDFPGRVLSAANAV